MRRQDREVTDAEKIRKIIDKCHCCRIGFYDDGQIYIVPLNFGYLQKDGNLILYFHGAKEGRKIELIKKNPEVGFELDTNYQLVEADNACAYSSRFQSIIGNGRIFLVTNEEEKRKGIQAVMRHNTGRQDWEFRGNMLDMISVFKIEVSGLSCKERM